MALKNVRIILVNPSHPGNIGSVARAMKTMTLDRLYLVNPKQFPHENATTFASHAEDVLEQAMVTSSLDEAIKGCELVFGTSARVREFPKPMFNAREMAEKIIHEFQDREVAVVFGRERCGLENHELAKCHYHVRIPANEDYSALNLAASVQVMTYELRMAMLQEQGMPKYPKLQSQLPKAEDLESLYQHIENTMIDIGFLNPKTPRRMMLRIRRILTRALIDQDDLDLLRGMMRTIQTTCQKKK